MLADISNMADPIVHPRVDQFYDSAIMPYFHKALYICLDQLVKDHSVVVFYTNQQLCKGKGLFQSALCSSWM